MIEIFSFFFTVQSSCIVFFISKIAGTDDDLPPTHRNRFQSGVRSAGNGRSAVGGGASQPSLHSDMETQIHNIEQEAYTSVLRAFKAQSDAITWVLSLSISCTLDLCSINGC
jgi:hypothetical protein